jgi:hypothetical protein
MKNHLYRFTIEHLADKDGNETGANPLVFEKGMHDDLFKIIDAMKSKALLDEGDTIAFVTGLKLFGEILLKNPDNALFQQFKPQFASFMKELKSGSGS